MQETDKDIFEKDAKDYLPVFNRYKIVLDHGEGAYLWDNNGKKYLDFLGGIAVNVLGHDYEPLVTAISEQAKKLIHCSNLYYTQPQADAAAKLVELSASTRRSSAIRAPRQTRVPSRLRASTRISSTRRNPRSSRPGTASTAARSRR